MFDLQEKYTRRSATIDSGDFEGVLRMLDFLYDATVKDRLVNVAQMDRRELMNWLHDIQSTTRELLDELRQAS